MRNRSIRFIALGAPLALLCGCMFGPNFKAPDVPKAEHWREVESTFQGKPADDAEWWKVFNDPVLTSLVEKAFAQNLTLQTASMRVVQARLGRAISKDLQLPAITAGGSFAHAKLSRSVQPDVDVQLSDKAQNALDLIDLLGKDRGGTTVSVTPEIDVYDAGFDAIWELDLWGGKRRGVESANSKMLAAYANYDSVMVSVAAEVAALYVQIRALDLRMAALNKTIGQQTEFTSMTEERFKNKKAAETDVLLAKTLTGVGEGGMPALRNSRRQAENALCVLLAIAPQELDFLLGKSTSIPTVKQDIVAGVPAELLRRRPDVRMAEHLAQAQCARIGIAKADIMPSFKVFGNIGFASSDSDNFFDDKSARSAYGGAFSATGLILYPLTVKRVRMEDAKFEEAMLNYQQTMLLAEQEVENAMFGYVQEQEQLSIAQDTSKTASRATDMAMVAYKGGKVIVSVPLVALSISGSQEDAVILNESQASLSLIAMYKALGGGWQNRTDKELVPEEIRERMMDRSDWWTFGGKSQLATQQNK